MIEAAKFSIPNIEVLVFFSVGFIIWFRFFRHTKKKETKAISKLQKAKDTKMDEPLTLHPEINPDLCGGCGGCTRACPEGDILQLINNKAVLVTPTKCVGHGECEVACPFGAIDLVFGTKTRGMDIPRVSSNYETNVPGLYIAGELGGMGLIRNAIKQGTLAAKDALAKIPNVKTDYDLLIVGGGPAGLAAGLVAIKEQKNYIILEQNSFGGTVFNFPRQKVVMSHPAELPIVGTMKFASNKVTKEELLSYWDNIRAKTGLKVTEQCRFEELKQMPDGTFEVKTGKGIMTAKRVMLAMGVRGSPRRLGLPNEDLPKVTYNLIDAEQYNQKNIAVVGGGNAGVEAAQSLAKASLGNKVHLLVRGDAFDRCNEENQRIIFEMEKQGLVTIWYKSSVQEIQKDHLIIKKDQESLNVPNDFVFVFAGAEVPFKFLMSLGIHIDKKFGEGFKKKQASSF
jgi:thioredoxin reductase/NAD-dependent dihydropyrimidine dehydrogenase PreA subunit